MSNVEQLHRDEQWAEVMGRLRNLTEHGGPPHNGGNGGGDDMERRVSKLETSVDAILTGIGDIRVSQASVLERMDRVMDKVRDMPTERRVSEMLSNKLTLACTVLGVFIAIVALIADKG